MPVSHAHAACWRFTEGSRRRLFRGAPRSAPHQPGIPRGRDSAPGTRLLNPSAGACSQPIQPRTTIALFVSVRQDVHQLIRLRTLLGALLSCRNEYVGYPHAYALANLAWLFVVGGS